MQQGNKTLAICTQGEREMEYLLEVFTRYFGEMLEIVPVYLHELDNVQLEPRAVMTTHVTKEPAEKAFPNSHVFFTERCLTGHNLEEIIRLPAKTEVLVVNYPARSARETLDSLVDLGINHISMSLYWPGAQTDLSDYSVVVYAGILDYCPKGDFQYINIGHRSVSISTIIVLIKIFDLSPMCAENYYYDSIRKITDGCYKLESMLRETNLMRDSLEGICNLNPNIIFVLNEKNQITNFNPAAEKYFRKRKEDVIGSCYQEQLKEQVGLVEAITSGERLSDSLVFANGQELLVTANTFHINDCNNRVIYVVPVAELQRTESKARIKLHSKDFAAKYYFEEIIGDSLCIKKSIKIAQTYAYSDATVLLSGESGTGKELFAQSIHNASKRVGYPFVGINFAALPESLAESELFGYNEGAFTGALKGGKEGLFEIAHQGTIFLDEIGDASLPMQTKLLRVLEEREVVRVGGTKVVPVDVRIICATNKNLKEMIRNHTFREDLYYRIKVLTLNIPTLRERKGDIVTIINSMLRKNMAYCLRDESILQRLCNYNWPGNIRELKATAEYINMLGGLPGVGKEGDSGIRDMLIEFLDINLKDSFDSFGTFIQEEQREVQTPKMLHTRQEFSCISDDLLLILREISVLQKSNIIAGRGSLSRCLAIREGGLTETMVKTRLKKLEKLGLIMIGVTKQGVCLTDAGRDRIEIRK